jgi:hypothetical protein
MRWKGSAAMSKQDNRVVVEHVLRPGARLRCKQELATTARAWRLADGSGMRGVRGRAAGEGTGPG